MSDGSEGPSGPQLTPPVDPARDHVRGPTDAPVTLVEYGDYECPHCGRAHPIVETVRERLGSDLRFVFRNFPLGTQHPHAERAAAAAEAAGSQGAFWPMHDHLFDNQDALTEADLLEYARAVGLDLDRFQDDLAAGTFEDRIREDVRSGARSGVNGTPTFFVGGRRFDGDWNDIDAFVDALERDR